MLGGVCNISLPNLGICWARVLQWKGQWRFEMVNVGEQLASVEKWGVLHQVAIQGTSRDPGPFCAPKIQTAPQRDKAAGNYCICQMSHWTIKPQCLACLLGQATFVGVQHLRLRFRLCFHRFGRRGRGCCCRGRRRAREAGAIGGLDVMRHGKGRKLNL